MKDLLISGSGTSEVSVLFSTLSEKHASSSVSVDQVKRFLPKVEPELFSPCINHGYVIFVQGMLNELITDPSFNGLLD
jgi:hypothetical protein